MLWLLVLLLLLLPLKFSWRLDCEQARALSCVWACFVTQWLLVLWLLLLMVDCLGCQHWDWLVQLAEAWRLRVSSSVAFALTCLLHLQLWLVVLLLQHYGVYCVEAAGIHLLGDVCFVMVMVLVLLGHAVVGSGGCVVLCCKRL